MFNSQEALWTIVTRFQIQRLFFMQITGHSELKPQNLQLSMHHNMNSQHKTELSIPRRMPLSKKNSDSHLTEPISYSSRGYQA